MRERVFEARPDWYESGVRPRILRRTAIACLVLAASAAWWFLTGAWVAVVVIVAVVLERMFEFANASNTRKMIESMRVTVSDEGLMLTGAGLETGAFYPWRSLRADSEISEDGSVSSITIEES